MKEFVCHSGGAAGADYYFEIFGKDFNVKTIAYSYKTKHHYAENKKELNQAEFHEGCQMVERTNVTLQRFRYHRMINLLARNWFQVKHADEIFAVGTIKRTNDLQFVKGGTGWAVQMAIDSNKPVYVFDQNETRWYYWDFTRNEFLVYEGEPRISSNNFAGIGTRKINMFGIQAIENLYQNTFKNANMRILYLHGLESKLSAEKRLILEDFGEVVAPDLDYFVDENCISLVYEKYKNEKFDVIIGSSMGGFAGFYLSQMMNKPAFLFNPALKERSVFQEIPNGNFHKTKITILLGAKDDVVPNEKTFSFLENYKTDSQITILINQEMAHGVPISVFKNELSNYLKNL